jgi:cysteinyl-tRNA synthetase
MRDLLADWPGEVLRFNMLRSHYRQPIDWTVKGLEESAKTLDDWYALVGDTPGDVVSGAVLESLLDDLNTPRAITELHGLRHRAQAQDRLASEELAASLRFLGFLNDSAARWTERKHTAQGIDASGVETLIAARTAARKSKNFAESDRIRDELLVAGIVLEDGPSGTTWRRR